MSLRILDLSPTEFLSLTEAWLTLAVVDLAIRLLPFGYWRRWLLPSDGRHATGTGSRITVLVTAVERAARHHLVPMNCLRRSLALRNVLRRRGIPVRLHLGVRRGETGIEAHAWVSSDGRILNDTEDVTERYAELKPEQWDEIIAGPMG